MSTLGARSLAAQRWVPVTRGTPPRYAPGNVGGDLVPAHPRASNRPSTQYVVPYATQDYRHSTPLGASLEAAMAPAAPGLV